jgi:hypothetical protein
MLQGPKAHEVHTTPVETSGGPHSAAVYLGPGWVAPATCHFLTRHSRDGQCLWTAERSTAGGDGALREGHSIWAAEEDVTHCHWSPEEEAREEDV